MTVQLPCSGRQLDRLGARLRETYPDISREDEELFEQVLAVYDEKLVNVTTQLSALNLPAVRRIKTITTLVDKLQRQPTLGLKQVHDIAGARIVLPPNEGRHDQDIASMRIRGAFQNPKAPQLIDRREEPNHGYRAVHVIVYPDHIPVEIQVRTHMQDAWAQVIEKLGDEWGRGLRYGEQLVDAEAPAFPTWTRSPTRRQLLHDLLVISDQIAAIEEDQVLLRQVNLNIAELEAQISDADPAELRDDLNLQIAEARSNSQEAAERLEATMQGMGRLLGALRGV